MGGREKVSPRKGCAARQLGMTDLDRVKQSVSDGVVVHPSKCILEGL